MEKLTFDDDFENSYTSRKSNKSSKLALAAVIVILLGLIICGILIYEWLNSTPGLTTTTTNVFAENSAVVPQAPVNTTDSTFTIPSFTELENKVQPIEIEDKTESSIPSTAVALTTEVKTDPVSLSEPTIGIVENDVLSDLASLLLIPTIEEVTEVAEVVEVPEVPEEVPQVVEPVIEPVVIDENYYIAKEGDTLSSIVKKLFLLISVEDLKTVNNLTSEELIVGQRIFIPEAAAKFSRSNTTSRIVDLNLIKNYKRSGSNK